MAFVFKPYANLLDPGLRYGLIGHWGFDVDCLDIPGGKTFDLSFNNNTGTSSNTAADFLDNGQVRNAMRNGRVDSTNAYTLRSDSYFPAGAAPRTVTGWVYRLVNVSFGSWFSYGTGSTTNALYISVNQSFLDVDTHGSAWNSNTSMNLNQWYHLGVTNDGLVTRTYVNGLPDGGPTSQVPNTILSGNAYLGKDVFNRTFNGYLDDIRIYNRVFTANEIWNLYNAGMNGIREFPEEDELPARFAQAAVAQSFPTSMDASFDYVRRIIPATDTNIYVP